MAFTAMQEHPHRPNLTSPNPRGTLPVIEVTTLDSATPKSNRATPITAPRSIPLIIAWVLAVAAILLTIAIRIRLLGTPLERDEGEFAYMGQLILKGIAPYKVAYNMKLPGIYGVYALIMAVFGQTVVGIHIGLLLANLATSILVFLLGRRLWNTQVALIAAATYPILTIGPAVYGLSAHATQFQMPMVLGGSILLLKALECRRYGLLFWSGLLMGMAYVTKQQAIMFAAFGGCYLVWALLRSREFELPLILKRAAIYALGAAIPLAAVCIIVLASGAFGKFWFWTFSYARQYVSLITPDAGLGLLTYTSSYMLAFIPWLAALGGIGLAAVWIDRISRERAAFITAFLLFGFLATAPGLYFRAHYFVLVMPAVSLLIGVAVTWTSRLLSQLRFAALLQVLPLVLLAAAAAQTIAVSGELFFKSTPTEASRIVYGGSPFPESIVIARYIKEHTKPGEKIAVLGSEPQIYFYADRPSATGYLYAYGLAEVQPLAHQMQQEVIREVESAKPKYIIYVNLGGSWLLRTRSDRTILYWLADYAALHYKVVGLVNIVSSDQTDYYWGEDADYYAPAVAQGICIFERKPDR